MEIDWNKGPSDGDLRAFHTIPQCPDRDFGIFMTQDKGNDWDGLSELAEMDGVIMPETDYENLPDLNPVTSPIAAVRTFISKLGIPGLSIYHVLKIVGFPAASYVLCPGDHNIKAIAAGATAATVIGALPISPTFYALGTLVGAKVGLKVVEKFKKPSPKP